VVVVRPSSSYARQIQLRYSQLSLAFRISLERRIRLPESGYRAGVFSKVMVRASDLYRTKITVPDRGYFVICQDTENNTFALWESDETAK
jgi:hypothetical protein